MFLCHGFGEHLGWYEELATILVQEGVMVFGHDHQVSQKMVFTALSIRTSSRVTAGARGRGCLWTVWRTTCRT